MSDNDVIPVRLSHLLRHCSVGAIVRGPEYLMAVVDIREWTDKNGRVAARLIPYVDQVRSALGIDEELREPPIAKELDNGQIDGVPIPAIRFPFWMRCPTCGALHHRPWTRLPKHAKPRCTSIKCVEKPILEQVPWVLVHHLGYMADVDWHYLAHRDSKKPKQKACRRNWKEPYLRLKEAGASGRLISCYLCGSSAKIEANKPLPFGNKPMQPWLKREPSESIQDDTTEDGIVIQINDIRVHSPVTCNALVIPPESRIRKGTVVDQLYRSSQKRQQIDQARNELARKGVFRTFASEYRCSPQDVESAWKDIQNGYPLYGQSLTPGILLESEYQALLDELPDVFDDEDFVARHRTDAWRSFIEDLPQGSRICAIARTASRLIAVTRLKEIQVFKGFKRPLKNEESALVPPDIIGKSDWLPAIELYGEGVFFTLDETVLQRWEQHSGLRQRAAISQTRYDQANILRDRSGEQLGFRVRPRFLLMHTLAHIIIRLIESEAGYPAASLKERIYCAEGKKPMSGILIYVAVPDVVGSLGGLVEIAEPMRFLKLLTGAFDHAEWCSLDPVCAEHEGHGPYILNRAACHACALIPEPSCAYGNVLLDRVFIKGDLTEGIPAFLDYVDTSG